MNGLCAVGDHDTLDVSNLATILGRSPKAEVVNGVKVRSLTERILSCGSGVTYIVPMLLSTDESDIGVDTVRQICRRRESLRSEGSGRESRLSYGQRYRRSSDEKA